MEARIAKLEETNRLLTKVCMRLTQQVNALLKVSTVNLKMTQACVESLADVRAMVFPLEFGEKEDVI